MATWKKSSIKNICILGRGRVISQSEIFKNLGIYPVYSSQSKNNGEMGRIKTYDFEGEYVTWTTDGAYAGTVFYRNGRFNCTNVCGTLLGRGGVNMRYLAYSFGSIAKKHVSYVGNPKLMNNIVADIEINLPEDITEQEKIAEILAKIDTAIQLTESSISKQERVKKGLMQDLLANGIDENGNIRSEETHKFKDSELGRIPEEWDVINLGNIAHIEMGQSPSGSTYNDDELGVLFLQGSNTFGESFPFTHQYTTKPTKISKLGSILFSVRAPVGDINISNKEYCIGRGLCSIFGKNNNISEFLYFLLLENNRKFKALGQGSTFEAINKDELNKFLVSKIDPIEQKKIVNVLNKQSNTLVYEKTQLSKLQKIKSGLMQDLLTGKVRVDNLLLQ